MTHEEDIIKGGRRWIKAGTILLIISAILTLILIVDGHSAQQQGSQAGQQPGPGIRQQGERTKKRSSFGSKTEHTEMSRIYDRDHHTIDMGYAYSAGRGGEEEKCSLVFTHKGTMRVFMSGAEVSFIIDGKRLDLGEVAYLTDYYFLWMTQIETLRLDLTREQLARIMRARQVEMKLGEFEFTFGPEAQAVVSELASVQGDKP